MTDLQALVLGFVQGVGEFLPISSSAHLVLLPWLLGWPYAGLTFDVALHVGTLVAVVAFFWRDWLDLCREGLRGRATPEGRLFWYLVIATLPGALFGYLLEEQAKTVFRNPLLIGIMLMVMGIVLYLADTRVGERKRLNDIGLMDSLIIGMSQAMAIIPGVSRSGITMAAARVLGISREASARFSFLLSTPIILGAGISQLTEMTLADIDRAFFIGVITSALVGFLSIKFLLTYLTRRNFGVFVWYRLLAGCFVIIVYFLR